MNIYIEKYKGIHPGIILDQELKKRLLQNDLLLYLLVSIRKLYIQLQKCKRNLNISLALKIEEKLGLEEGTLALLQTYFDINRGKIKKKSFILLICH